MSVIVNRSSFSYLGGAVGDSGWAEVLNNTEHPG